MAPCFGPLARIYFSQNERTNMSDKPQEDFHSHLCKFDNAMLVTRATDGQLRCRPMVIAGTEQDADLWFATSIDSGKAQEILAAPQVCVAMQDGGLYLSISGVAELSQDAAKIDELWSEAWKVWFPNGKQDPSLALIRVTATEGEFWDRSGLKRLTYLFKAGKAYLLGDRPNVDKDDTHQKVNL